MENRADFNYYDMMGATGKSYARALEPVCREWELTRNELDMLLFLYNNPAFDRAADIVSRRGIAKSHVSLGVTGLEEKGLLVRQPDEHDRRITHLQLTDPGRKIAAQARELQTRFFRALFQGLSQEELKLWSELVRKVSRNAENLEKALDNIR